MSQHDAPTLDRSTPTARRARLTGWGLGPETEAWVSSPADHDGVLAAVLSPCSSASAGRARARSRAIDGWPLAMDMLARGS